MRENGLRNYNPDGMEGFVYKVPKKHTNYGNVSPSRVGVPAFLRLDATILI